MALLLVLFDLLLQLPKPFLQPLLQLFFFSFPLSEFLFKPRATLSKTGQLFLVSPEDGLFLLKQLRKQDRLLLGQPPVLCVGCLQMRESLADNSRVICLTKDLAELVLDGQWEVGHEEVAKLVGFILVVPHPLVKLVHVPGQSLHSLAECLLVELFGVEHAVTVLQLLKPFLARVYGQLARA